MMTAGFVSELWRYPVKSMGGHSIDDAAIDRLGIADDRRYGLRDLESGKILSAKHPKVGALLLAMTADFDGETRRIAVTIDGEVFDSEDPIALDAKLSAALGRQVRVERATTADELFESYWPEVDGLALSDIHTDLPMAMLTERGTFVDSAALHIVASSSLEYLARLAPDSQISSRRFRPSLVVDTSDIYPRVGEDATGFIENTWIERTATLGEARIKITSVSPRCIMVTLAQHGHNSDPAVLRTLAEHNRMSLFNVGDFACLGVYAEVISPGRLAVGDSLIFDSQAT